MELIHMSTELEPNGRTSVTTLWEDDNEIKLSVPGHKLGQTLRDIASIVDDNVNPQLLQWQVD